MKAVIFVTLMIIGVAICSPFEKYPKECPPHEDPSNPTLLPHPTDCTKFMKCMDGIPYPLDCPPGLHWNIEKNYCDYPAEAHCVRPLPPV